MIMMMMMNKMAFLSPHIDTKNWIEMVRSGLMPHIITVRIGTEATLKNSYDGKRVK